MVVTPGTDPQCYSLWLRSRPANPPMRIEYVAHPEDVGALYAHFWRRSGYFRRRMALLALIPVIIFLAPPLLSHRAPTAHELVTALAFALLLPVLAPFIARWRTKRGCRVLEIGSEGITTTIGHTSGSIPWGRVAVVDVTPGHVFILGTNLNGFAIPQSAFASEAKRGEFVQRVSEYWAAMARSRADPSLSQEAADDVATVRDAGTTPVAYATFNRRVRAVLIDAALILAGMVIVVIADSALNGLPGTGRVEFALILALLVFYEPIFVWRRGATIGHAAVRVRVVANATGRNPTLVQAFARYLLKCVLGLPSFVTMALTRRHQAVHDALTRTTVRVPDLSGMDVMDYHLERVVDPTGQLPSAGRRLLVIGLYLVAAFVALGIASNLFLSPDCIGARECTSAEHIGEQVIALAWLAVSLLIIVAGWRGHLFGSRLRRPDAASIDV